MILTCLLSTEIACIGMNGKESVDPLEKDSAAVSLDGLVDVSGYAQSARASLFQETLSATMGSAYLGW
eukprot:c27025_g1_i1 orf=32-235(+)